MSRLATANLAWSAGQNWDEHPLTAGRITKHLGQKFTRQSVQRSLPPQNVGDSLVSRMVEMWEKFPKDIKYEMNQQRAKKKISEWIGQGGHL